MSSPNNKVALLFNKPGVFPGLEDIVSAHIQLPVYTSILLTKKNYEHVVITTVVPSNQVLPNLFKDIDESILTLVPDPNKQGERSVVIEGHIKGMILLSLLKHMLATAKQMFSQKIKVLHVFGTEKYALLSVVYKILMPWIKIVWSTENYSNETSKLKKFLISNLISQVITTTDFVSTNLDYCSDVKRISRGIVRKFELDKAANKHRILFWRDPSRENGADIAFEVYKRVADEYPDIQFTFAVRPHWDSVVKPEDCESYDNIEMHVFPYQKGITIEQLLSESICVLFPFRELSTNPQLAVIETLYSEVPVICSNVESNEEALDLVGMNYQLNDDVDSYVGKLKEVLDGYIHSDNLLLPNKAKMDEYYSWEKYIDSCMNSYQ